jgi:hypothetical protein
MLVDTTHLVNFARRVTQCLLVLIGFFTQAGACSGTSRPDRRAAVHRLSSFRTQEGTIAPQSAARRPQCGWKNTRLRARGPTVVFDPLPTQRGYSTLAVDLNMVTQPLTMIKETLPSGFHRTAEPIG